MAQILERGQQGFYLALMHECRALPLGVAELEVADKAPRARLE